MGTRALVGLLTAFALACAPRASRLPEPEAEVTFQPLRSDEAGWAADLEGAERRFVLNAREVYALHTHTAFILGELRHKGRAYRSLLLSTHDSGRTWHEVLPPLGSSEVTHVAFHGCNGWALVGWTVEGPGDLVLFATKDCGRGWERRSELVKEHWSGWPDGIWIDPSGTKGEIQLSYDEDSGIEGPATLWSKDGGRSFTRVPGPGKVVPLDPEREALYAKSPNGAEWKLGVGETRYRVLVRLSEADPWELRGTLPIDLEVQDGRFIAFTGG